MWQLGRRLNNTAANKNVNKEKWHWEQDAGFLLTC